MGGKNGGGGSGYQVQVAVILEKQTAVTLLQALKLLLETGAAEDLLLALALALGDVNGGKKKKGKKGKGKNGGKSYSRPTPKSQTLGKPTSSSGGPRGGGKMTSSPKPTTSGKPKPASKSGGKPKR